MVLTQWHGSMKNFAVVIFKMVEINQNTFPLCHRVQLFEFQLYESLLDLHGELQQAGSKIKHVYREVPI